MTTIVTHNGTFHADDIFAVATLTLVLDDELDIVRTRDEDQITEADFVVDVGGEYDPKRNRFDHHQPEGAGERENGVPYASFGLVWKHFGESLCGSSKVAQIIDDQLVQPVDALDNGMDISEGLIPGLRDYSLHNIVSVFRPTWIEEQETHDEDDRFEDLIVLARVLLEREIRVATDNVAGEKVVLEAYERAEDKRLIELPASLPWGVLNDFEEPLFVVYPKNDETWSLKCVRESTDSFQNRLDLPESWAGKRGVELQEVTGVDDAIFVHRARFIAVTGSREGILELARQALQNS